MFQVSDIRKLYSNLRQDVNTTFGDVFKDAVAMAEKVDVTPEKPRVARRQQLRANAPSDSVEEHFRVNCAVPFLDHINSTLEQKFDGSFP